MQDQTVYYDLGTATCLTANPLAFQGCRSFFYQTTNFIRTAPITARITGGSCRRETQYTKVSQSFPTLGLSEARTIPNPIETESGELHILIAYHGFGYRATLEVE